MNKYIVIFLLISGLFSCQETSDKKKNTDFNPNDYKILTDSIHLYSKDLGLDSLLVYTSVSPKKEEVECSYEYTFKTFQYNLDSIPMNNRITVIAAFWHFYKEQESPLNPDYIDHDVLQYNNQIVKWKGVYDKKIYDFYVKVYDSEPKAIEDVNGFQYFHSFSYLDKEVKFYIKNNQAEVFKCRHRFIFFF